MKHTLIILTFICLSIYSCDTFYHIPMVKNSDKLTINSDCGKIEIQLINWQGHAFDFYQDYNLNGEIILRKDSIKVYYKKQKYSCGFIGEKNFRKKEIKITGIGEIRTAFRIKNRIKKNDTITIIFGGYMYCNSKKINIDTINLIVPEDLNPPFTFKKNN